MAATLANLIEYYIFVFIGSACTNIYSVIEHRARSDHIEHVSVYKLGFTEIKVVKIRRFLDKFSHFLFGVVDHLLVQFNVVVDPIRAQNKPDHGAEVTTAGSYVQKVL
ncbi:hypothetical protein BpHYR1_043866 [Brachionus plicatilis]|uniref:Uncharacterized protein n=1 Tax=Brachionus plicatilis TaxID=10195 RepID=A0A3M7S9I6_BRAPC|nr:hypothetical protein BpHYR1_043866 [Brachionus plicatilis]